MIGKTIKKKVSNKTVKNKKEKKKSVQRGGYLDIKSKIKMLEDEEKKIKQEIFELKKMLNTVKEEKNNKFKKVIKGLGIIGTLGAASYLGYKYGHKIADKSAVNTGDKSQIQMEEIV